VERKRGNRLLRNTNTPLEKKGEETIIRTLKTAKLIDGFWERWLVHGLDLADLNHARPKLTNLEQWEQAWESLTKIKVIEANQLAQCGCVHEAERLYRQIGLYFYLNYWIVPWFSKKKKDWYDLCLTFMQEADLLSKIHTLHRTVWIDHFQCFGRVRKTDIPIGCIIIINPIDSSKEELYKYEMDFVDAGFNTISFDGPGQGETFLRNQVFGTRRNWEKFINQVIEYSCDLFPDIPKYLFGTSLGASWTLYGCSHKKIQKAVVVSPAVELYKMNVPSYFMGRMECSFYVEEPEMPIPNFHEINYQSSVLLFHGKKDGMIPSRDMYQLYQQISTEKQLIEYDDEGHCCNNKLEQIRKRAIQWFSEI
jgi:hypothetical protein